MPNKFFFSFIEGMRVSSFNLQSNTLFKKGSENCMKSKRPDNDSLHIGSLSGVRMLCARHLSASCWPPLRRVFCCTEAEDAKMEEWIERGRTPPFPTEMALPFTAQIKSLYYECNKRCRGQTRGCSCSMMEPLQHWTVSRITDVITDRCINSSLCPAFFNTSSLYASSSKHAFEAQRRLRLRPL